MNRQVAIGRLLALPPFAKNEKEKSQLFNVAIYEAFNHHIKNNELFRGFCEKQNFKLTGPLEDLTSYPYLSAGFFKKRNLISVPADNIKTVLYSSATTGKPSAIAIDAITSKRQTIASTKVMADYLGDHRRPFLILDEDPAGMKSVEISARSAATRGFLMLARSAEYFLKDVDGQLMLDIERFKDSLKRYERDSQEVCIFGFTFILYQHLVKRLKENSIRFQLPEGTKVAHIGGWKKLEGQQISKDVFLDDICNVLGITRFDIIDFYGFTEQMGLIYANVANQPKTIPVYSEIIIRDFQTLEPVSDGKIGLIQILTPLPYSYPGISVLTEDVGRILGRKRDKNGRWGTQFEIIGRAKESEIRGCGDILSEIIERAQI